MFFLLDTASETTSLFITIGYVLLKLNALIN
jgi:hypothetical protein